MSILPLAMLIKEVVDLIDSQSDVHAAQYGAAHIIFADQNIDRDWIREARYEKSENWEDYISDRVHDFPELSRQQVREEVHQVFAVLEKLLDYPDEVLELAEETYR